MKIVLNMVVCNEERRIGPMLAMTMPLVDHAVVVVQESQDQTREICKRMHAEVIDDACHDFADPSRPLAYDATPDGVWILCLDADELVLPQLAAELRTLEDGGFLGAELVFSHWVGGEHQGDGDPHYRFARKEHIHVPSVMHDPPRPVDVPEAQVYRPGYPAILHNKSWEEQLSGEEGYERWFARPEAKDILGPKWESLWGMSTHNLRNARSQGLTGREIDAMPFEQRWEQGFGRHDVR